MQMATKETIEARHRIFEIVQELRRRYPDETEEQTTKRLYEMATKDDALLTAMAEVIAGGLLDEQYDEAAREGREIPESLKRPS
jgi:hypothetical protein